MYEYPIEAYEEAGSWWSKCPDIPEAHSVGDTLEELLVNAVEGLTLALSIYVDQGRAIPLASPVGEKQHAIVLPATVTAKIALWNAMVEKNIRVAGLARELALSHPVASRLVDFEHNSKIEQVESALKALGTSIKKGSRSSTWIALPYGGPEAGFYAERLVDALKERGTTEIVIGAVAAPIDKIKPDSLDYLLRTRYAKSTSTMQAVTGVIDALVETKLFERVDVPGTNSSRPLKGIRAV